MDDAEARDVLRAHGEDVTPRGKLSEASRQRAQFLADQDSGDYTEGTSPEDFGPEPSETVAAEPPAVVAERKPRRVKATRTRTGLGARLRAQGKPKKRHPRVSVDQLISSAWAALGGLAAQVDPPVGRCLVMQAPVAGLILEDVVKGTAVDKVLQPIARAEERAEKVLALAAPPAIVAALEAAQQLPAEQRARREAILLPLLHRSLVLWVRIAGDQAERMMERQAEEGPAAEKAAELMRMILGTPVPAPEPDTVDV